MNGDDLLALRYDERAAVLLLGLRGLPDPAPWAPGGVQARPFARAVQSASFLPSFSAVRFDKAEPAERTVDERDRQQVTR